MVAVADYDPNPRTAGPAIVTEGPVDGSTVLVLDPAGAAKHADIPASWRSLTRDRQVVWCRLPTAEALAEAERAMSGLAERHVVVDVLTTGPVAEVAMAFALRHASAVRAVLLVDPAAPDPRYPAEDAEVADARWAERSWRQVAELDRAGVPVRIIAHSAGGSRDRVPPPLPLGHPDLVEVVRATVEALDDPGGEGGAGHAGHQH